MPITTLSSQAFCLAIGNARNATREGPVIVIDDDGRPAHVLLSFEEYQRMGGMLEVPVGDAGAEAGDPNEAVKPAEVGDSPWAFMLEALEEFEAEVELSSEEPAEKAFKRTT